jgi:RNA recognition motif-containing protein
LLSEDVLDKLGSSSESIFNTYFSIMNIFVARLNFKTRREDLEAAFAKFGQVTSAKIVKDRDTGRSKGFGFIEMANDEEANKAIAALNETEEKPSLIILPTTNGTRKFYCQEDRVSARPCPVLYFAFSD